MCRDSYEAILFRCSFLLAFFGFFRVGEITCTSKKDREFSKVLSINDIQRTKNGDVQIVLRFSKTDQCGKGTNIRLTRQHNPVICLVHALSEYTAVRPAVGGPLLCHINEQVLTRYQFSAILRKALSVLDPNLTHYSSHSFRLGAATTASKLGWSVEAIKVLGRWSSDAYKGYIHQ